MAKATPIDVQGSFAEVRCNATRTPTTTEDEARGSFAVLSGYRDGGVFIAHFAGTSEWERHPKGDELVQVVEGETELLLWVEGAEQRHRLAAGELLIVPANTWHRFETPGVKLLTVTPQPTDHRVEHPGGD
ncbi:MAG: cupin domain-containing protein [Myxococcota bacterium]